MPARHHSSRPTTSSKAKAAGRKPTGGKGGASAHASPHASPHGPAPGSEDRPVPATAPTAGEPAGPGEPTASGERTTAGERAARGEPPAAGAPTALGRIPILDVRPVVQHGRRPAKAVTGESFEVSATVFREGHDAVGANVVLRDPAGRPGPWTPMRELAPGTDRWGATVTPDAPGRWTYTVEAWSDPLTTWRGHAGIKIPAGIDSELVLAEGALLYERAAAGVPEAERGPVLHAVAALRDRDRPAAWRLASALAPEVAEVLGRYPLRELVTASDAMPLLVERERALYGSWYEF
ncbi:maltotransferase domain-containing protein, partial [Streptomyces sp. NPDC038707]|uniref:maltotransferase domain-containing protein n=1 Tax=Streptomyces sp. NPDC038707 TaxID=3154329 RepID=UPI0033F226DC